MKILVITHSKDLLQLYKKGFKSLKAEVVGLGEKVNGTDIVLIDLQNDLRRNVWVYTSLRREGLFDGAIRISLVNYLKGILKKHLPMIGQEQPMYLNKSKNFMPLNERQRKEELIIIP